MLTAVRIMKTTLGITALLVFACLLGNEAKAHPLLDDAIVSYEDADFRSALRTFNLAARDADLSVEELLLLFEMRALVHHAMGNETAMLQDLARLGAVRPSHRLGGLTPPPVRKAFDDMLEANGGTLGVELVIEEKDFDGKPFIVARVEKVPRGLVHRIGLQCRIPPDGRNMARTAQGTRARMELPESGQHEGCEATAQTKRGTVLFSAGIEGTRAPPPPPPPPVVSPLPPPVAPQPSPTQSAAIFRTSEHTESVDEPTTKKKKWPWFVAAAVVMVAGGVTAGIVVSKGSKQSQPQPGGVTVNW